MTHPGSGLLTLGFAVWGLSVVLTALFLLEPFLPFTACDLVRDRYLVGEPGRSWVPPGLTCTYTGRELPGLGDTEHVVGPSPWRLVVVGLAVGLLPVCLRLRRLLRPLRHPEPARTS